MDTYIATNTRNGKFYIGSTTNFEWRKYCHLKKITNYPFQNALQKHPEDFIWEVWSDDSDEPILEQALLDMYFGKEQCYNLNPTAGRPPAQSGHTPETIEKMKRTRNDPEFKAKVGEWVKRHFEDPDHREYHRQRTIEGSNTPEALQKNSERSAETWAKPGHKEKMQQIHREKWNDPEYREKQMRSRQNLRWWVNPAGERTRSKTSPGPDWQIGTKWKPNSN